MMAHAVADAFVGDCAVPGKRVIGRRRVMMMMFETSERKDRVRTSEARSARSVRAMVGRSWC